MWRWWVYILPLACFMWQAEGRRTAPLLTDEDGIRKNMIRAAECTFGGQARELGSTWFADLGPPFGVMYCIKCECVRVQKKKRIVAKVQCRNIKHECPKPSCDEPVLHEGRCCKICPGDVYSPDTPQDLPYVVTIEEEEKDARHFAALVLGKGRAPVAARFLLRRRSMHFSLEGAAGPSGPRTLQIIDSTGSTLQEIPLGDIKLAERTCGVWRRLPRDYRRLLREGRLSAALLWSGETEASAIGQIITHKALGTEMFSSLMEAEPGYGPLTNGWGATAAVTALAGATPSLHITLMFTGALQADDGKDARVMVTLEVLDKNNTVLDEVHHIQKPKDLNIIELKSPVSVDKLRLLARGRLGLSIRSVKTATGAIRPAIKGPILPRLACEYFFAPLAASGKAIASPSSGAAWFHLSRDGELVYNVQVDELNMMDAPMITLVDETNKRHMELEDLTPFLDGKATGSLNRMGPRILDPLYSGDLVVNVATHSDESIVRGRLIPRPVSDLMDLNGPIILKRTDISKPADIVGLAWVSVDYECSIQWEIAIAGPGSSILSMTNLELWLEMRPLIAPGAPVVARKLGTLDTPEGAMVSPTILDLQRLHTGASEFVVREPRTNLTLIKALLRPIKMPESCLPQYADNEVPAVSYISSNPNSAENTIGETVSCFHSGSFHKDGAQWRSANEPCTMCFCDHGIVKCDTVLCPPLTCRAKAMIRPGDCCPTCSNSSLQDTNTSMTQGCHLAEQFHYAGQSWHPYIPPAGFDTCTICTCESRYLVVQCTNVQCPTLSCPEKVAYRPDKKSCCKVCPEVKSENKSYENGELKDEALRQSPEEIMAAGGCRYRNGPVFNGQEWHPNVYPHGEQKCVLCRCKDGHIMCDRKKCSKCVAMGPAGRRKSQHKGYQHKQMPPDECCQQHCRRYRRHQRHHRNRS